MDEPDDDLRATAYQAALPIVAACAQELDELTAGV